MKEFDSFHLNTEKEIKRSTFSFHHSQSIFFFFFKWSNSTVYHSDIYIYISSLRQSKRKNAERAINIYSLIRNERENFRWLWSKDAGGKWTFIANRLNHRAIFVFFFFTTLNCPLLIIDIQHYIMIMENTMKSSCISFENEMQRQSAHIFYLVLENAHFEQIDLMKMIYIALWTH